MKLLFITPKIDELDDDLAFASLWSKSFAEEGFDVTVLCGHKGQSSLPFPVYGMGHGQGSRDPRPILRFIWKVLTLKYDRVFVHMNARWLMFGSWYWWLRRIPVYFWYTHYTVPFSFRVSLPAITRLFAATAESLPQFNADPRKTVTGHGIDTGFWDVPESAEREPATHLLAVHRISRSKRLDIVIRALAQLPPEYTLTHYGRPLDPTADVAYEQELKALVAELGLQDRVRFMGSVPMPKLKEIYPRFQVFVNVVPKTIDKSALEAMYCGCTPVLMRGQAEAIGGLTFPGAETPEVLAAYIRGMRIMSRAELRQIVEERHGLRRLVRVMGEYIRDGR